MSIANSINRKLLPTLISAGTLLAGASFAQAEDNNEKADHNYFEELVVTASRRDQSARDVIGNVGVVSGENLEQISATSFEDYLKLTPGVQFNKGDSQQSVIAIRGISTTTGVSQTQQPVGIYLDETPFTDFFSFTSVPDLLPFDLERVEVLRGPQGTLYGSASLGGAIRYITRKPNLDEHEAKIGITLSSTRSGDLNHLVNAMGNAALSDTFAVRGVVSYKEDGGYVDNITPGFEESDWNETDQLTARLQAKWQPSDQLSITGMLFQQNSDVDGVSTPTDTDSLTINDFGLRYTEFDYTIGNLLVEYDFGNITLTSSTSYADKQRESEYVGGPTQAAVQAAGFEAALSLPAGSLASIGSVSTDERGSKGLTQEIRLVSNNDGPFNWVAGIFYTDVESELETIATNPGVEDVINGLVPGFGTLLFPDDVRFVGAFEQDAKEYSIYAEATIDLNDQWELTVGGRHYWYDSNTTLTIGGVPDAGIEASQNDFMPKISLAYHASEELTFYALFSEGYRLGGANNLAVTSPGAPTSFESDGLENYELGMKSSWMDGRLLVDITGYYLEWTDIQLDGFFTNPIFGTITATQNAGKASSRGIELQLQAALSDSLRFTSAINWSDAQLDETISNVAGAVDGTPLPGNRDWSISNVLTFSTVIADRETDFTFSHQYADETTNNIGEQFKVDGYNLFDLQGLMRFDNGVDVSLFVKNLTDERAQYSASNDYAFIGLPRTWGLATPRTIGISINKTF